MTIDPSATLNINDSETGVYNDNNISQHRLCTSTYMHITSHSYILCIPQVSYKDTKMSVAKAVENYIMTSGRGSSHDIENFQYVKSVTFVKAFHESWRSSVSNDPYYKIAIVNIDIPPRYTENDSQVYTNGEDAFYNSVCRGDIVIHLCDGSGRYWTDAFFLAHPRTYFQATQATQSIQKQKNTKSEDCEIQDATFQKWKYEFKIRQLERKIKEHENTIRQNTLDAIRTQDTVNQYAESIRFLSRQQLGSPELQGLRSYDVAMTTFVSELNNRYARVCVSDTTFLEVNRNMKMKEMNGYAINACDECDACQELIHSIDHTSVEHRDELFNNIQKMICKVNKSVQQFEKLHLKAERSLFGLRNRRVLEDFGMYLNTALEVVEEVTSRVSMFTQDLDYARCYGQLFRKQGQQIDNDSNCGTLSSLRLGYKYDYDYSEDADEVYENEDYNTGYNTGIESVQQMLHYFDEGNQELYKQQEKQEGQEGQERQEQQEQQQDQVSLKSKSEMNENLPSITGVSGVYHEEVVIIQGEKNDTVSNNVTSEENVTTVTETNKKEEIHQEKRKSGGWFSSWF